MPGIVDDGVMGAGTGYGQFGGPGRVIITHVAPSVAADPR